jgi:hypothetical protein
MSIFLIALFVLFHLIRMNLCSYYAAFFPICHLEHWFTFVVDFKWKLFAFLDSFYGPKSEYQLAVQEPLVRFFDPNFCFKFYLLF